MGLSRVLVLATTSFATIARGEWVTGSLPRVVTSNTTVTYESGCAVDPIIDPGLVVIGGPVYGGRAVFTQAVAISEDQLGIASLLRTTQGASALAATPGSDRGSDNCPGIRVTSFALTGTNPTWGFLMNPLEGQPFIDPATMQSCFRRVYYLNNLGSNTTIGGTNATPGKRTVTFTVFGAPDGGSPSSGDDYVDVQDRLAGEACPSGPIWR